jgi:hypothetical protein
VAFVVLNVIKRVFNSKMRLIPTDHVYRFLSSRQFFLWCITAGGVETPIIRPVKFTLLKARLQDSGWLWIEF